MISVLRGDREVRKGCRSASSGRRRSGAVLVAVIACILIVVALVGGAMKSTLTARRQCKLELQMQQAEMLLQAGIDRLSATNSKPSQASEVALADLSTWDARATLPEFAIAEVIYQRSSTDAGASPALRCTARLGVSSSPEHVIQITRDWMVSSQSKPTSPPP